MRDSTEWVIASWLRESMKQDVRRVKNRQLDATSRTSSSPPSVESFLPSNCPSTRRPATGSNANFCCLHRVMPRTSQKLSYAWTRDYVILPLLRGFGTISITDGAPSEPLSTDALWGIRASLLKNLYQRRSFATTPCRRRLSRACSCHLQVCA